MAAKARSSDDRSHEKAEFDKPLDTWTEGDVQCFVNSNFSAEIAKKLKVRFRLFLRLWLRCCLSREIDFLDFTNVS